MSNFHFESRFSQEDWDILNRIISRSNYTANSWLTNQITDFCKQIGLPLLNNVTPTGRYRDIGLWPPEVAFPNLNTTNLEILRRFAHFKQMSVTQVILRYIITQHIMEEEERMIKSR